MDIIGPNLFWGLIVLAAVVVALLLRRRRRAEAARRPVVPTPPSNPVIDDAEYLDSSHIGGPVFDDAVLDAAREKAAHEAAARPDRR